ncbi:ankyrin repeat domain-containing protein [Legionella massiliensis]|uniref:ankyrin repeat domain-containing protein n=1 Tax=Legionella massiliensis TaxID=1034943 RepID=UPI0005C4C3B8|nr:ankyrin repeat domain-containing protein [Legionella massiliensis]
MKNGHNDYERHQAIPTLYNILEANNSFIPYVYHFNRPAVVERLAAFRLFQEDELPKSMDEAIAFQEASPNHYTHLHLAVMMRDMETVKELYESGMVIPDAKDAYGRTALEIAVANGSIDTALLILDNRKEASIEISANWFANAFRMGFNEGFDRLLAHPLIKVNLVEVVAVALQNQSLELAEALIRNYSINPNIFIQSALLSYDLSTVELLQRLGADVYTKDNMANTALHHASWLLDERVCIYLFKQTPASLTEKNNAGESPFDIILQQAREHSAAPSEYSQKAQKVVGLLVEMYPFNLSDRNHQQMLTTLLEYAMDINDHALFTQIAEKAKNNLFILDKTLVMDGMKMTLLHKALITNKTDFAQTLVEVGANPSRRICNETQRFSGNPLVGKSGADLMPDSLAPKENRRLQGG